MSQYYLLVDNNRTPLAVASNMELVDAYIADVKNHKIYYDRRVKLDLERREHNKKLSIIQPRYRGKEYTKDINEIKTIISNKPHLKTALQPELDRLDALVKQEKERKAEFFKDYEETKLEAETSWYNKLSPKDKMIWDGNWDNAKDGIVPSFKKINFIG